MTTLNHSLVRRSRGMLVIAAAFATLMAGTIVARPDGVATPQGIEHRA